MFPLSYLHVCFLLVSSAHFKRKSLDSPICCWNMWNGFWLLWYFCSHIGYVMRKLTGIVHKFSYLQTQWAVCLTVLSRSSFPPTVQAHISLIGNSKVLVGVSVSQRWVCTEETAMLDLMSFLNFRPNRFYLLQYFICHFKPFTFLFEGRRSCYVFLFFLYILRAARNLSFALRRFGVGDKRFDFSPLPLGEATFKDERPDIFSGSVWLPRASHQQPPLPSLRPVLHHVLFTYLFNPHHPPPTAHFLSGPLKLISS